MRENHGGFTLPGEAGYEKLTLELAKKWGADVIRDSDGTVLSDEILSAGYGIYSTICIIRDHNEWARKNMDKLQESFLVTQPKVAVENTITFRIMDDFFEEQFAVNETVDSLKYWQVYDRTTNKEVDRNKWNYRKKSQEVVVQDVEPWHKYTVSFLAYRIWEEISMYNHTTNEWDKEHLMQLDPRYPETQNYMLEWMNEWCETHPDTTVVRFTSMFYNFVWIWGSDEKNRHLFTDWGSYDFAVSPLALKEFEKKFGYSLTAEDFVNQGKYNVTHVPCSQHKKDWMEFVIDFVVEFGKKLVDIVHQYGKKAYMFYDDSWIGTEPYHPRYKEFGFDGLIKCVFSGYEARLCAGVPVETHELRLHPYLFPVGLGGVPTFKKGGNPTLDAQKYWINVRRALVRQPVERIGLGGYLHLVKDYPDFVEYIENVTHEFHLLRKLHHLEKPYTLKPKVAILHSWGKLRPWTLSGHLHETYMHDLIHINESLAGLPLDVQFIDFNDLVQEDITTIDIIINAGKKGSAWSGGDAWKSDMLIDKLTQWVYEGGCFIGVNEPSAVDGYDTQFRLAHILGIDIDDGAKVCHGRWNYQLSEIEGVLPDTFAIKGKENVYLNNPNTKVLDDEDGIPKLTVNYFGKGTGIYLTSFETSEGNTRLLMNLILHGAGESLEQDCISDNYYVETAYFPKQNTLLLINNSLEEQYCNVKVSSNLVDTYIQPLEIKEICLD